MRLKLPVIRPASSSWEKEIKYKKFLILSEPEYSIQKSDYPFFGPFVYKLLNSQNCYLFGVKLVKLNPLPCHGFSQRDPSGENPWQRMNEQWLDFYQFCELSRLNNLTPRYL